MGHERTVLPPIPTFLVSCFPYPCGCKFLILICSYPDLGKNGLSEHFHCVKVYISLHRIKLPLSCSDILVSLLLNQLFLKQLQTRHQAKPPPPSCISQASCSTQFQQMYWEMHHCSLKSSGHLSSNSLQLPSCQYLLSQKASREVV